MTATRETKPRAIGMWGMPVTEARFGHRRQVSDLRMRHGRVGCWRRVRARGGGAKQGRRSRGPLQVEVIRRMLPNRLIAETRQTGDDSATTQEDEVAGCAKLVTMDDARTIAGQPDVRMRLAVHEGQEPTYPMPTHSVMFAATGEVLANEMISSPTRTGALKGINDSAHRVKRKSPRGTWTVAPISPRIPSRSGTIYWRKLTSCSS
jgi:hypothetical protein